MPHKSKSNCCEGVTQRLWVCLCVSIHTEYTLSPLNNTLLVSPCSIFVEILFCKGKAPGPLSLSTGLVAGIRCFHRHDPTSAPGWKPKPHFKPLQAKATWDHKVLYKNLISCNSSNIWQMRKFRFRETKQTAPIWTVGVLKSLRLKLSFFRCHRPCSTPCGRAASAHRLLILNFCLKDSNRDQIRKISEFFLSRPGK